MTNREYTNAVGRRKETTATVKLYAKGAGNILVKTATGKEYTLAEGIFTSIRMQFCLLLHLVMMYSKNLMQKSRL